MQISVQIKNSINKILKLMRHANPPSQCPIHLCMK